jgi:ankyrin repeat protein
MLTPERAKLEKQMIKIAKAGDAMAVREVAEADPTLLEARDKDGCTPLHCAAWRGDTQMAAILLDLGADIAARNQNDHYGDTALHAAAHGNHKAVVALLLERGADREAVSAAGRTPLQETEQHRAAAAARLLKA